jgi:hypothetical protein
MENNENQDVQDVQDAEVLEETIAQEAKNQVKIEDFADLIPDEDEQEDEYSEQDGEYSEQEDGYSEQDDENNVTQKRTMIPESGAPSKELAESVVCLFEFGTELMFNFTVLKNYEIPADYDVYTPRERKNLAKVFEQLFRTNPTVQKYLNPTVNAGMVLIGVLLSSIGRAKKLKRKLEKEQEQEKQAQGNVLPFYVVQEQPQKKRGRPRKSS